MTEVVHCKKEKFDVYIGRPGIWSNPFPITKDCTRKESIKKFEEYARTNKEIQEHLMELDGKVLGCWCKPKACHGDVLVKLLQERKNGRIRG